MLSFSGWPLAAEPACRANQWEESTDSSAAEGKPIVGSVIPRTLAQGVCEPANDPIFQWSDAGFEQEGYCPKCSKCRMSKYTLSGNSTEDGTRAGEKSGN